MLSCTQLTTRQRRQLIVFESQEVVQSNFLHYKTFAIKLPLMTEMKQRGFLKLVISEQPEHCICALVANFLWMLGWPGEGCHARFA